MNLLNMFLVFGLALCFGITQTNAQNVTIPDANFKAYLVGYNLINTNGDSEIQVSEASAYTWKIDCSNRNIADLTGIEAFVNLQELYVDDNNLTSLDMSQNTALTDLWCSRNINLTSLNVSQNTALIRLYCDDNINLTSLDVSQNTTLTSLGCSRNINLTSLDVSQNTALTWLTCSNNANLTSLDLSQNTALTSLECKYNANLTNFDVSQNLNLTELYCSGMNLTSLDLSHHTNLTDLGCSYNDLTSLNIKNGNNTSITQFSANNNPNLQCIQVDDSLYSTSLWIYIDATTLFSTNCSTFNSITTVNTLPNISTYPNPTTKSLTIDLAKIYEEVSIEVTNVTGQIILSKNLGSVSSTTTELEGATGVYFVKIQTEKGQQVLKVIKE